MGRGREGEESGHLLWSPTLCLIQSLKRDHKVALSESPQALEDFPNSSHPQQDGFPLARHHPAQQPSPAGEQRVVAASQAGPPCFINLLSNVALLPRGSRRSGGSRRLIHHDQEETEVQREGVLTSGVTRRGWSSFSERVEGVLLQNHALRRQETETSASTVVTNRSGMRHRK